MGRARLAALHGVATSYQPTPRGTVAVPDSTVVAVLAALGIDASTPGAVRAALDHHDHGARQRLLPPTLVLRSGRPPGPGTLPDLPEGAVLRVQTESGDSLDWGLDRSSPEIRLPLGVHTLRAHAPDGRSSRATLIVAPARMPAPPERTHGFLLQLYSLLSDRSWGLGDLGDLSEFASWAGRAPAAGFVQLNPLHAAVPGRPTDPSPYRPGSRRFPDPVYLRVADVPEFARLPGELRARAAELAARAGELRAGVLHRGALIDRDAVWRLKRTALELVWTVPLSSRRHAAYRRFLDERGQALEDHATWCALAEVHGPRWRSWPAGLDDPRSARTERAREELRGRVDFHRWLSWLTDEQLAGAQRAAEEAGMPVGLVHDLAVGVHPEGADSWAQQELFASGMSVGAPPDAFNTRGQDWGLPPWRPDVLADSGYTPYRELLQAALRHAGGLRLDHAMGLFRLWWVPEGRDPAEGTYVRYDAEAMLGTLALAAHRANAVVVGEDLGTVEPGVRERLADSGVLGTSVLWFERGEGRPSGAERRPAGEPAPPPAEPLSQPLAPGAWRSGCLATVTTHDLPSTAARLTGDHLRLRHRLGLLARPLAVEQAELDAELGQWRVLLDRLGLLPEGAWGGSGAPDERAVIEAVHRFVAGTPARMVGIWLPDGVGDRRPQNLPGTCREYPNWRLPIADDRGRPVTLGQLMASDRLRSLVAAVAAAGAGRAGAPSPAAPARAGTGPGGRRDGVRKPV
ncbi:4-alpha-glucanotransferase [Streptomyces sp. TP-A0874]|uniref:4-alpha-glucanotransferase n=1 Tax=Streptomyces sp. TP-A0874 TaxID=549819 RepID=UPI000852C5BB|nr:4-alpha-glucanotransferase [Streptomyces sp. TP-A0874]